MTQVMQIFNAKWSRDGSNCGFDCLKVWGPRFLQICSNCHDLAIFPDIPLIFLAFVRIFLELRRRACSVVWSSPVLVLGIKTLGPRTRTRTGPILCSRTRTRTTTGPGLQSYSGPGPVQTGPGPDQSQTSPDQFRTGLMSVNKSPYAQISLAYLYRHANYLSKWQHKSRHAWNQYISINLYSGSGHINVCEGLKH